MKNSKVKLYYLKVNVLLKNLKMKIKDLKKKIELLERNRNFWYNEYQNLKNENK